MQCKRILAAGMAMLCLLAATACTPHESSGTDSTYVVVEPVAEPEDVTAMTFSPSGTQVTYNRFLTAESQLLLAAPADAEIYYTTDGSAPSKDTMRYTQPIVLTQVAGSFPTVLHLRAQAYFADGSTSEAAAATFFTGAEIESRFQTLVCSISGDPDLLTNAPDGILYGKNYEQRGRESEREVRVEIFDRHGKLLLEQGAGARIFGAASRESSIKSLKLYARRSYDAAYGKFALDVFGTQGADGEIIGKYDKLVLRNAGNDFQFAFIRDELNQRLAAQAGYTDCEGVLPIVVYLNGAYYGCMWLHETFCDDLLKDKYGGVEGAYCILEGSEQEKWADESDAEQSAATAEFNETYAALAALDLTDDAAYAQVEAFMDVENYLQNFAFNIYVNNNDWPQNNYKCYRYVAGENEVTTSPQTDGRWRFLLHDMDYCMGLYEQEGTAANYNNLAQILDEKSDRYAPLFAHLMARADCRTYFREEMQRLMEGALSAVSIGEMLDTMNGERYFEMRYYFEYLEKRKQSDSSIWIWYDGYQQQTQQIRKFLMQRGEYMEQFLAAAFDA